MDNFKRDMKALANTLYYLRLKFGFALFHIYKWTEEQLDYICMIVLENGNKLIENYQQSLEELSMLDNPENK